MEVADGGVLFLDEISSMPMDIQAKLLRALEERAFRRVGGTVLDQSGRADPGCVEPRSEDNDQGWPVS